MEVGGGLKTTYVPKWSVNGLSSFDHLLASPNDLATFARMRQ
jgi:hypothetical protein